jgi:predicted RNase H-like nuclease (RuvC/YqgF family)
MANELEKTTETTETNTNQNSGNDTVDLKELQLKIKALESENGKLKQSVTNASADASKWKKQYQDKLSEEDKAKELQDEATAAMQKELEDLRQERNIAKYTGELVDARIGMDAETAKLVAVALNAGETDKVFDGIRQFIVAHDKSLRESALKNNQTLPGGSAEKTVTREEFKAMSLSEMMAFKVEHPDLYAEYTK